MTGAELGGRPPSRGDPFRQSHRAISGSQKENIPIFDPEVERAKYHKELEDLKAELKTLQYTIDNHKQEEELGKLRHESELRDVRRKAEDDFKKMQAADGERSKAVRQHDSLLKEVTEIRDAASNEKAALEKRVREVEESKRVLEEEVEDIRSEKEEGLRIVERKVVELESKNETLQQTVGELQQDSDQRESLLQQVQQQLAEKETAYGELEGENIRLKAQTGDVETLGIIKRELSEQVTHIRKLESLNREQAAELKHFKKIHKAVEIVEEEKRTLQRKLEAAGGLQIELDEAMMQRQRLQDERLAWTAYLESQAGPDGQLEFDSPEALARALVAERLQTASFVERIGAVEAELSSKDSTIQALDEEKSKLNEQIEKLKSTSGTATNNKAQQRLERQKALAIKEAEYLRAQLRTYDTEDNTFQPETIDEAKTKRIQELEDIIDQYRGEVETLNTDLKTRETAPTLTLSPAKRPRDDSEDNERLGELLRRNRKLQDELAAIQTSSKLLQKELSVAKERLTAAKKQSESRILSLRSNPTSNFEAIKLSTLTTLRKENSDLMTQLRTSQPALSSVPLASYEALQLEVQDAEREVESSKKQIVRLKQVWGAKSAEFRKNISLLVGWDVVFMKDGMRVTSDFYPSKGDVENSILFDDKKGTMKISGGPESAFAGKIRDQLNFWVKERDCIPGFLAALTLEFWDEANRDGTLVVNV